MSWLLDTDVICQPAKRHGDARVVAWLHQERERCFTSAVVIAQLAYWVRSKEGRKRRELQDWLRRLVDALGGRILGFNVSVAHVWADQEHLLEKHGQRMPVEDGYIAATARRHGLTIVTAYGHTVSIHARSDRSGRRAEPEERAQLEGFARELPRLWQAPGVRMQDKKRIVRCLIENAVVTVCQAETLQAQVHWGGGEVNTVEVPRGRSGVHRYVTDPEMVALVRVLAAEFADDQIARILHRKRLKRSKGLPFNAQRVTNIRTRYDIAGHTRAKLGGEPHVYTVEQAAQHLRVSRRTLDKWIATGLLRARQLTQGAPWQVQVSEADRRRLGATEAPEGWLTGSR